MSPLPSSQGALRDKSTWVELGHAACWAAGGAVGAGFAASTEGLAAAWIVGVSGGFSSLCSDVVDDIDAATTTVEPDPPPPLDLPIGPEAEPIGPDTQTQPDDPPPDGGGDASKKKPDDTGPTQQAD